MIDEQFKKWFQKVVDENNAVIEGTIGVRIVFAYQCIKCGKYYNDGCDILDHIEVCDGVEKIE